MSRAPLERLSIRAALALGFSVTLGLWLVTGYTFSRRMEEVERQASEVAARYTRGQDLLTTVRTQVLVGSIRLRDALLNPDKTALADYRRQIDDTYATISDALSEYEPVLGAANDEQIARMRQEVDAFYKTTTSVLEDPSGPSVRDLLNRRIMPRREAAVNIVEDIQRLNRIAFIRQQADIATIHREAEQRSWIGLGVAVGLSLAVLLVVAVYAGRLERRLRRQMTHVSTISDELQAASLKLLTAQEEERRIIARELHDEVGQVLTAIKVELALAERALEAKGASAEPLATAQVIADGALQTVRDLTQLLHPSTLDDLGLPAAIETSLRTLAQRHQIHADLVQEGMPDRMAPETEVAAYRIVQEALTNVARHAGATRCRVHLRRRPGTLVVEVDDDGSGFDPTARAPSGRRGIGLIGIRERATQLGGTVDIQSAPGQGTRVVVELPEGQRVA